MSKKLFISFQKPSTIIPQLTKSRRTFLNRRSSTKPIRLKLTPYKRRYITIFQRITFSHRLQTTIRCRNRGEFQFFQLLLPARRRYFFIFNFRITKTKSNLLISFIFFHNTGKIFKPSRMDIQSFS